MKITKIENSDAYKAFTAIHNSIYDSRFTADIKHIRTGLNISNVKLRESKKYCGNHPAACELGGAHRKYKYLEGADWIEFLDLLNDALDSIGCSANVASSVCIIRKGEFRRTKYSHHYVREFPEWDKDNPESYRKGGANSEFPEGTPGTNTRINYSVVG